jgi:hypothetical protein
VFILELEADGNRTDWFYIHIVAKDGLASRSQTRYLWLPSSHIHHGVNAIFIHCKKAMSECAKFRC